MLDRVTFIFKETMSDSNSNPLARFFGPSFFATSSASSEANGGAANANPAVGVVSRGESIVVNGPEVIQRPPAQPPQGPASTSGIPAPLVSNSVKRALNRPSGSSTKTMLQLLEHEKLQRKSSDDDSSDS